MASKTAVAPNPETIFAQLEASKAQNPNAHNFDNIVTPEEAEQDENVAITVSEMAGEDGKPIAREGITFYPRSPKLRALDAMTETLAAMQKGGLKQGEAILHIACFCLVVDDAQTSKRRAATFDEVADSFDLGDVELLTRLSAKYLNLGVKPLTGNASKNA